MSRPADSLTRNMIFHWYTRALTTQEDTHFTRARVRKERQCTIFTTMPYFIATKWQAQSVSQARSSRANISRKTAVIFKEDTSSARINLHIIPHTLGTTSGSPHGCNTIIFTTRILFYFKADIRLFIEDKANLSLHYPLLWC